MTGKVGPIAIVASGPEEEDLNTGTPAILMCGHDVRVVHTLHVDVLV